MSKALGSGLLAFVTVALLALPSPATADDVSASSGHRPAVIVLSPVWRPLPEPPKTAPPSLQLAYQVASDWSHFVRMNGQHVRRLRELQRRHGSERPIQTTAMIPAAKDLALQERLLTALERVESETGRAGPWLLHLRGALQHARADSQFEIEDRRYLQQLSDDSGAAAAELGPPEPPDHAMAIATWRRLAVEFPDHPQRGDLLYQLAYLENQRGAEAAAATLLRGVLCPERTAPLETPEPSAYAEAMRVESEREALGGDQPYQRCRPMAMAHDLRTAAWALLGDVHFHGVGQLRHAASAFARAADEARSWRRALYLYQLGWSAYRMDDYPRAIAAFDRLLRPGQVGRALADQVAALRPEAMQYLSICFVELWQTQVGSGRSPTTSVVATVTQHYAGQASDTSDAHVREVLVGVGDVLSAMTETVPAAEAWRAAIALQPDHPDVAELEQRIADTKHRP